jgi:glyoxylase-like metal-dependent hydrolase (beta-lactamase superfamily II)
MRYRILPVTPFAQNCSLIWCEATGRAAFVDPGGEAELLLAAAEAEGVRPERILLTHGHLDHVGAAQALSERLDLPIEGPHAADAFWLQQLAQQASLFGFPPARPFEPHRWLADGDRVRVGELELEVIHCPGHTPGHVVFFHRAGRLAFVGDVLFRGSVGRTDFPLSDGRALLACIRGRLFPLGDDVAFVPGHGPMSSFGEERRHNPYVGD